MRLYTRYKPLRPPEKSGSGPLIILLAGLTVLAWWWYPKASNTAPGSNPADHHRTVTRSTPPAPSIGQTTPKAQVRAERALLNQEPALPLPLERPTDPTRTATNFIPLEAPTGIARPVQNVLETQIALARRGFSSGSIDGLAGEQTRSALRAFQRSQHLPVTGLLDAETRSRLLLSSPLLSQYALGTAELEGLQPLGQTWLEKSQQTTLAYESPLELVAEKFCSHPTLIRRLNPGIVWTNVAPGVSIVVPNIEQPVITNKAAWVRIELGRKSLEAFDAETNLLAHFPCSIAQRVEKRPVGALRVAVLAPHPNYLFDPENFPESAEARELNRKLILPPGPNNPVGTSWIGLDRPGYGIHGTPKPEDVGRTESHGCFRLANWNADHLLRLVVPGTPVVVDP